MNWELIIVCIVMYEVGWWFRGLYEYWKRKGDE